MRVMPTTLNDIMTISSGITLGKVTEYDTPPSEGGIKLIRPQDLAQSLLLDEPALCDIPYILKPQNLKSNIKPEHYLRVNDIILSARSTSYQVAMIREVPQNTQLLISNNMICLRPLDAYAYYSATQAVLVYLNAHWFRDQVVKKEFPKMINITVKWVKELTFDLPTHAKCQQLAQALDAYTQLHQHQRQLLQSAGLRLDALLFDQFNKDTK